LSSVSFLIAVCGAALLPVPPDSGMSLILARPGVRFGPVLGWVGRGKERLLLSGAIAPPVPRCAKRALLSRCIRTACSRGLSLVLDCERGRPDRASLTERCRATVWRIMSTAFVRRFTRSSSEPAMSRDFMRRLRLYGDGGIRLL
jgi:hypothetical protein